jgi:hypothetical protein
MVEAGFSISGVLSRWLQYSARKTKVEICVRIVRLPKLQFIQIDFCGLNFHHRLTLSRMKYYTNYGLNESSSSEMLGADFALYCSLSKVAIV